LRETQAFTVAQDEARVQTSFWPHVDVAHRPLLWRITIVLGTHGVLGTPAFFYAAELAQDGYDWEGLFTVVVIAAGPATLLGYVAGGRLSDRAGRRPVLIGSALVMVLGVALVFSEQRWLFAPGFFLLAGADAGLVAVRPAYISELFPTEVRPPSCRLSSGHGVDRRPPNRVCTCRGGIGRRVCGSRRGLHNRFAGHAAVSAGHAPVGLRLTTRPGCAVTQPLACNPSSTTAPEEFGA
jgi:hypothetical protein